MNVPNVCYPAKVDIQISTILGEKKQSGNLLANYAKNDKRDEKTVNTLHFVIAIQGNGRLPMCLYARRGTGIVL